MKTWLFDLDGTLTDSRPGIEASFRFALDRRSRPYTGELSWCVGPPIRESFSRLLGTDDSSEVEAAVIHYREYFSEKGLFENSVYEGIPELLENLAERGDRLFVATSKPQVYAKRIVDHFGLGQFFSGVYGSGLDGHLSDKGELIRSILEREAIAPACVSMVGDRKHDIRGAKINSLPSIGVLWGYGTRAELEDAGADRIAARPEHIADVEP